MRERAMEDFIRQSTGRLLRLAYLLTGDNGAAEDLVQEVMLGELRNWARTDSPEQRRSHVLRQLIRTHLATRPQTTSTERIFDTDIVAFGDALSTQRDGNASRVETRQALHDLPPLQRTVLVLMCFENLDEEEAAELLDLTLPRVTELAHRASTAMRSNWPGSARMLAAAEGPGS